MRLNRQYLQILLPALCLALFPACSKVGVSSLTGHPESIYFSVGRGDCAEIEASSTRTVVDPVSGDVKWSPADKIALWARTSGGNFTLEALPCHIYGYDGGRAIFTGTIPSAMPDGQYSYVACHPQPVSVNGTSVSFELPSGQDGSAGSGSDIMISSAVSYGPLKSSDSSDGGMLGMKMHHLVHVLNCHITDMSPLDGAKVQRIVLTMPQNAVGTLSTDLFSPSDARLSNGSNVIEILPVNPIASASDYASVAVFPSTYNGRIQAVIYADGLVAYASDIDVKSRSFLPGHSTAVALRIEKVSQDYSLSFTLKDNNLGETVRKVDFEIVSGGGTFGGDGVLSYSWAPAEGVVPGSTVTFTYPDSESFNALAGSKINVTYDSDHVSVSENVVLPKPSSSSLKVSLTAPYLMSEDFSGVSSFSSHDEYSSGFNSGSKDPYSFLNGWTGGRIGAQKGTSIRIACRRETSADYSARVDSAPLPAIKKAVKVNVSFDYGANSKFGGLDIIVDGDVGQTVFLGYSTSRSGYASDSKEGVFEEGNNFYIKENTGSYTELPNHGEMTLTLPAGSTNRITFRTEVEHRAGTTNTTCWLYLDNIKVQVAR